MEHLIPTIAGVLGGVALVLSVGGAIESIARSWWRRQRGDHLEVVIDGERYIIDVGRIDSEDSDKIHKAVKAVRQAREASKPDRHKIAA